MSAMRALSIAALLLLSLMTGPARAQNGSEYVQAVQLGLEEFEARNFLEARTHFLRAHELAPSARTSRALGMVEFELKNYAEAARFLHQAMTDKQKPLEPPKLVEAERLYKRANGYLARITLDIAAGTSVFVDGSRSELRAGDDLVLGLGEHQLEFRAPNYITDKRVLHVKGGEHSTLRVALVPVTEHASASAARGDDTGSARPLYKNPWLWTAVGVVVVGAAAGTAVALTHDPGTRSGPVDTGNGTRALVGGRQ